MQQKFGFEKFCFSLIQINNNNKKNLSHLFPEKLSKTFFLHVVTDTPNWPVSVEISCDLLWLLHIL